MSCDHEGLLLKLCNWMQYNYLLTNLSFVIFFSFYYSSVVRFSGAVDEPFMFPAEINCSNHNDPVPVSNAKDRNPLTENNNPETVKKH